ncbi:MAG: lipid-transfer protein [Acidimicrobiia bacterium]|nr:lipid-transfer protein [Acidimicrobiia bacterium]MBV9283468.1 lipid-transfer protein [Acidimicrobiia bacterium]
MTANGSGLAGKAAIVGIGATEFSKDSGRTELRLATEAVKMALDDAGLAPSDVDGMVTFTMDSNDEIEIARSVGIGDLTYFSRIHHGGGAACGTVHSAAMAVATGAAEVVVTYRALNGRSWSRFGAGVQRRQPIPNADGVHYGWLVPFGLLTPAQWVAMFARRYMHAYGATSADFGTVAVADRRHAANNPNAWFYEQPITLEDHQASRWIVEPLHLLDCCQESDGAVAQIVTTVERARDLKQPPVVIAAAAQGAGRDQESMTSYYRDDMTGLPEMGVVARQLWAQSGLKTDDIRTAVLYDHFTPFVLAQLEEFGFCGRGEAKDFIAGGAIEVGGRLPVNTNGGQLGEAYVHGMNGISEGVRQVRGTSVNQVEGDGAVLVTAGTGVPTSGLILTSDN